MKLIGFRNSTTSLRYAVLEIEGDRAEFSNSSNEHCIKYPKELEESGEKLEWLFDEVHRILRKYTDAACCAIKVSEYGRAEKKASRFTSYADAITILACKKAGMHIAEYVYSQLPVSSTSVKNYSEDLAGKSDKYWDNQIADAIAVAYAVGEVING